MGTRIPLRGHQPFLGGILTGRLGEVVAFVRSLKSVQIIDCTEDVTKFPMLPRAVSFAAPELMLLCEEVPSFF